VAISLRSKLGPDEYKRHIYQTLINSHAPYELLIKNLSYFHTMSQVRTLLITSLKLDHTKITIRFKGVPPSKVKHAGFAYVTCHDAPTAQAIVYLDNIWLLGMKLEVELNCHRYTAKQ
jgi:hypothetical protein